MPNTVPAADTGLPSYDLDDIIYDAGDLHSLLDTMNDCLLGLDYGVGKERNHALDRVASLTRIALALASKISDGAGANYALIIASIRAGA
jgi:hypothetical protein